MAYASIYPVTYNKRWFTNKKKHSEENTRRPVTYEHSITLLVLIVDAMLLESGRKNLPCGVLQIEFEAL